MSWHQIRIFIHTQFIQLPTFETLPESSSTTRMAPSPSNSSTRAQDSVPQSTSVQSDGGATGREWPAIVPQLGRSSLAICIDSSRGMLEVASYYLKPDGPPSGTMLTAQAGGLYLASLCMLLAAWSADPRLANGPEGSLPDEDIAEQLSGRSSVDKEARRQYARGLMRDVQRCLDVLKCSEKFWQPGGKCWYASHRVRCVISD